MFRGSGRGRGRTMPDTRPTCQLCGQYEHVVINYWHKLDESFTHAPTQVKDPEFSTNYTDKHVDVTIKPLSLGFDGSC